MVKVKICGITHLEDAQAATSAGADMLGFVFYEKSPRYISPKKAKEIIGRLPDTIIKVALFVNEEKEKVSDIIRQIERVNILQFHGDETPEYCSSFDKSVIKAIRVKDRVSLDEIEKFNVNFIMLDAFKKDAYGGTGLNFDWQLVKGAKKSDAPIILSGGLNPKNVKEAIETVQPFGVDVSSGVESSPGRKDAGLLRDFIKQAKGAQPKGI